eukprot:Gregarina_sp_Poly_1__4206@NODE_229_length_11141_cov_173_244537_g203_i0_p2_GENE_NODE_229_length_11141_cov_173_244537_g203_i0NODE_229_length_11141_cov_173_244537_g203_i0_p2_ORF_typecomplete_len633_score126_88HOOK/PF05622_12/0_0025HOOK/PF05622_12/0_0001MAD/PF05557_13/7e06CEP63/PF17045_5/1_8e04CEP63/PF17045_5/0_00044Filament/PF00038_21/1_3Filament/PF00038_21/0_13Filament/PF00038_21/61HAP1_N/PF04849_13/1_6HAP1_N/PF04849_13/2_5HAP1_N/PF04849_13/35NPV_P10/PF05531_12/38NPV_P10/PF05531_12/4_2e02NPV_P10/P
MKRFVRFLVPILSTGLIAVMVSDLKGPSQSGKQRRKHLAFFFVPSETQHSGPPAGCPHPFPSMAFTSNANYVAKIRELEEQRNTLQSKLKSYDERVQNELTKIRDAWRERLDALKLENALLKQELFQRTEELALSQQESQLLNKYKRELFEKESMIESQRGRIQHSEQLEKQIKVQGSQQKRIDDLQRELQTMIRQKSVLETKNKELSRTLNEWQKVAIAYLDETSNGAPIEPEMFQNRLVEDHSNYARMELEHSAMSMEVLEMQKANKDVTARLKSLERDLKHSSLEVDDLRKALEAARIKEVKMTSQIGVLKRCLVKRLDSTDSNQSQEDKPQSPQTVPSKTLDDMEKEPLVLNLRTQLRDRKEEVELLRQDLDKAESKLTRVTELEAQVEALRNQLAKTASIKNQLITKVQKLQVAGATSGGRCTSSNSTDADMKGGDYYIECLQKARDNAVKRAETAKKEARLQKELTATLIQKVLGWTFNLHEDSDKFVIQLQSIYSPLTDRGWIQISTNKNELLALMDSKRMSLSTSPRVSEPNIGGRSAVSPTAEYTTPVPSQSTPSEPRMEMAFVGRYRDKWKSDSRWRSQLNHRKAFSTFLAFVCLDEHHSRQRRKGWPQPSPTSPAATLLNT